MALECEYCASIESHHKSISMFWTARGRRSPRWSSDGKRQKESEGVKYWSNFNHLTLLKVSRLCLQPVLSLFGTLCSGLNQCYVIGMYNLCYNNNHVFRCCWCYIHQQNSNLAVIWVCTHCLSLPSESTANWSCINSSKGGSEGAAVRCYLQEVNEKRRKRWKITESRWDQRRGCVDSKMGCDKGVKWAENGILMKESPGFTPVHWRR